MMTPLYKRDANGRKITLVKENHTTVDHLKRIIKKYPDWELCAESKNLLARAQEEKAQADKKKSKSTTWDGY